MTAVTLVPVIGAVCDCYIPRGFRLAPEPLDILPLMGGWSLLGIRCWVPRAHWAQGMLWGLRVSLLNRQGWVSTGDLPQGSEPRCPP